jgi:hypothetical protein
MIRNTLNKKCYTFEVDTSAFCPILYVISYESFALSFFPNLLFTVRIEWNRIRKGRLRSELCTSTVIDLLCSPSALAFSSPAAWTNWGVLLTEMLSKSPGFIKWWPRCRNLNGAVASQSQRMCEAVSDACLHLSHLGLIKCSSLNKCPFKWQCHVHNS